MHRLVRTGRPHLLAVGQAKHQVLDVQRGIQGRPVEVRRYPFPQEETKRPSVPSKEEGLSASRDYSRIERPLLVGISVAPSVSSVKSVACA